MTGPVPVCIDHACPNCEGGGEVGVSQDYWGNWDTRPCGVCRGEGFWPVLEPVPDLDASDYA